MTLLLLIEDILIIIIKNLTKEKDF